VSDCSDNAYQEAIEAAALGPDLQVLPAGDQTEIGEKGITLSGGQKARVALARAVVASKPGGLVLLDDPLAAVDAHVGAHMFEKCIVNALAGTTRLLVTNQLHFLRHADVANIVVMADGCIVEQGTFQALEANPESHLSNMLASLGGALRKQADQPSATEAALQPEPKKNNEASGKLTQAETKREGAVSPATFRFYFRALGGTVVFIGLWFSSWFFHLAELLPDLFLVAWSEDAFQESQSWYLGVWICVCLGGLALGTTARLTWVFRTTAGANTIHRDVLHRLVQCPMSFFDQTPSGRVMNRLGEDQMLVDFTCALHLEVLAISSWQVIDQLGMTIVACPLVAPFVVLYALLFMCIREVHRRSSRETLRWWMVTKSPMFHTFEEILSGVTTIAAFDRLEYFTNRFETALEANLRWLMSKDLGNLWTEQRLTLLGALVVGTLAVQVVLVPSLERPTLAAVALIYVLQLGFSLKTVSYFLVQVEGVFASVERIMEYTKTLPQEPPRQLPDDAGFDESTWHAANCSLEFQEVCVRYMPHLPRALDGVSARLGAMEKVGIVGRTGSGKSTIMGAIFRLLELESGHILLGGVDVSTVGVGLLRRLVTIVPQDPILFSGELRKNLDPLNARTDDKIWSALTRCSLDSFVGGLDGGLAAHIAEGGSNFSVGERQVLCLARALLREAPVLCLDEATANVDPTNDKRIQEILVTEVKGCLVLTIAHRLHTVLHSNRILVLDHGRLAQNDSPKALLATPGLFRDLANQAGITSASVPMAFGDDATRIESV
jgi:ABC-type multidrug transport system fused ATPase/permease subunit